MKNKGVFYAFSALLAVLAVLQNPLWSVISFILLMVFLQKRKKFTRKDMAVVLIVFLVFFIRSEVEVLQHKSKLSGEEQTFRISIQDISKINGDMLTMHAEEQNSGEKLLIKYRIKSEQEKNYLQKLLSSGLICTINGTLEQPKPSSNENLFNYKTYLERNHIYWLMKPQEIDRQSCQRTTGPLISLKNIRAKGIDYLEKYFPEESVPLAAALIFGTSDLISEDTMENYRILGIVHLLAISGLHITIIVAIVYYLMLRIGVTREKSVIILFICLPIYAVLAGASPSVNRSVLMTMLLLIGTWRRQRINVVDIISLTFLLYLFILPDSIYHIGFQLSFLTTFVILLSAPVILSRYEHPVSMMLATSYLSMVCTAPILLYSFFEFSLISILVNLLYIPLFNFVLLPYVLFSFVFHLLFSGFSAPFLFPLNSIIEFMNKLTEKIALLPWNMIILGRPNPLYLLLYGWGFFLFFLFWEAGAKGKWRWSLFLMPFLFFAGQYVMSHYSLEGEVTFLDVGQGDCIYIRLPLDKGTYLIDTGGNLEFEKEPWQMRKDKYEVGEDTVVPFLKSKGAVTIDKLILTHGDQDHAGGAEAILRELKVKELLLPDTAKQNELENRLIQLAKKQQIPVKLVHEGDVWKAGNYHFSILSPQEGSEAQANNGSVVLYTEIGGVKWLFTGDLEKEGEERLMRKYPYLHADVLKSGHHGSKSSTTEEFVEQISPHTAIISAGENNRYGHPHQEVIKRLEERKIKILRTDIHGAITYTFKKESGTFSVHHP